MSLAEKLVMEFNGLPEDKKQEVIDFVEFLKEKNKTNLDSMMDEVIDENIVALKELAK